MSFNKCLVSLFDELNAKNIHYSLIRDFESTEQVNTSKDIDVVIKKSDKKIAKQILKSLGWVTPRINLNLYAHEQFFKWNGSRLVELDVMWDIYYADGKYKLANQDDVFISQSYLEHAKIPRNEVALKLLVLHLLFDKDNVSEKNLTQLKRLYSLQDNCSGTICEVANSIIEKGGYDSKIVVDGRQRILSEGEAISHFSSHIKPLRRIKRYLHFIFSRIKWSRFFKPRQDPFKISIMGVDGCGKSSTIQMLQDYYKNSYVQYMGFRKNCWESDIAKETKNIHQLYKTQGLVAKIFHFHIVRFFYAMVFEGYYRYLKAVRSGADFVFFDRYYWEIYYATNKKLSKIIYYIFLKLLYPKPEVQVYLHCPIEESLRRKDDIDDVEDFIKTKKKWDHIYMNKKDVLTLDTSKLSLEEVCGAIIEQVVRVR